MKSTIIDTLGLKIYMFAQLRPARRALLLPLAAVSFSLASCNSSPPPSPSAATSGTAAPAASTGGSSPSSGGGGANVTLTGSGATFPAPLYQTWFQTYNQQNPNIRISYQAKGSGAGVKDFTDGTVDFGASDVAMKDEEIAKVKQGVVLLPMTAGSIVLAYNLPAVKGLKLSRQAYTDIFLGKIKTWNDPAIAKANPGAKLPSTPIKVVHRSDGSGTTAVFTSHLSAISPEWKSSVGTSKSVKWPVGSGAKGNDGVTAQIQQAQGSIGYVEYGYAQKNNVTFAALENKAGKYAEATPESAAKTLAAVQLPANLRAFITDPEGADSYPIVTYTWLLAYKKYSDPNKAKAMKDVVNWALTQGQQQSPTLGYIPLPNEVVDKVKAAANTIS